MKPSDITPAMIAEACKVDEGRLWRIAERTESQYHSPRPKLIKGRHREIDPPNHDFKKVLRRLHRYLQRSLTFPRCVHGGLRGRSCVTAAGNHVGRKYIVTRDVKDCYPSIPTEALRRRLIDEGFRSDTALLLSRLMTNRGVIPHGAPVSGDALNLFLADSDRRLDHCVRRRGGSYTRSADDMVVSVGARESVTPLARVIEDEIEGHGLRVSEHKRRQKGVQHSNTRGGPRVHNLLVNNRRGVGAVPEHRAKGLRLAESYVCGARSVRPETLEGLASRRAELVGMINYFRQLRFSPARHLARLLRQGDRLVRSRLSTVGVSLTAKWWVNSRKRNRPREIGDRWRLKSDNSPAA
ncbi:MAG: hypothetical protein HY763_03410 [Planctomycetes bacterium]|nr:hypothetical protein [Planctomycetota bacterium]